MSLVCRKILLNGMFETLEHLIVNVGRLFSYSFFSLFWPFEKSQQILWYQRVMQ